MTQPARDVISEDLSAFLDEYRRGAFETNADAVHCIHAVINELDAARAIGILVSDAPSIDELLDELRELEADAAEKAAIPTMPAKNRPPVPP